MNLLSACKKAGFSEAFLLPNSAYEEWTRHHKDGAFHSNADALEDDPLGAYPWANACLICVWPYLPYDDPHVVAAYYPASNQAYHAMEQLLQQLKEAGIRCERAQTPYRTQLLQAGIGTKMDNQLWYYPPYGTYVHLEGAMLSLQEPVAFTPPHANEPVCDHCGKCAAVCYGALENGRFIWQKCIRSYLEKDPIPDLFQDKLDTFMGCQRCQDSCPKNPKERAPVPKAVRDALDPVRILRGDMKEALAILGKNRKKHLIRQAIVLAANKGRTEALPYLQELKKNPDSPYSKELHYAIKHLQIQKNMIE